MDNSTKRNTKKHIDQIETYAHNDKSRINNPQVGLVTHDTDKDFKSKTYSYDPHIDPTLQWAGKTEHTSFEVRTVSLHIHERIDPKVIIQQARKENKDDQQELLWRDEERPLREDIQFYKHNNNWTNRLIAGDSLLVMNSLLEKESMAGKVQMFYMDPPYGIKYGSNFQAFVNETNVKDGEDADLTQEPETLKAFRDTWELGIHSYLTYIRDRLLMARELLNETGSCFVQISSENLHFIRNIMDEIFGKENFREQISFYTVVASTKKLANCLNYIIWYTKNNKKQKRKNCT